MGLIGSEMLFALVNNFRVIHIGGRLGGGKTTLAHMIAYHLLRSGQYHYLLSNVDSMWRDNPEDVQLRDEVCVDAVVILDEGGMFIDSIRDARQFVSFLRKLNMIVIVPSAEIPHNRMRSVVVQRDITLSSIGLPLWIYSVSLSSQFGSLATRFMWLFPSAIYGTFTTKGGPVDDEGLSLYMDFWIQNLAEKTKEKGQIVQAPPSGFAKVEGVQASPGTRSKKGSSKSSVELVQQMEDFGRAVDDLREVQERQAHTLQVAKRTKRRR